MQTGKTPLAPIVLLDAPGTGPIPGPEARAAVDVATPTGVDETPPRPWLTYGLIALAAVGLPLQVLWYQFDSWSVDLRYRPVYEVACSLVGCELPAMTDVGRIESKDKVVRSHPEVAGALIVDVLMINNAEFAQPYPVIELTFSTLQGQLVAGRRFRPDEYLGGEADPSGLMNPLTPIHVSLEVEDPGESAVNYNINFR